MMFFRLVEEGREEGREEEREEEGQRCKARQILIIGYGHHQPLLAQYPSGYGGYVVGVWHPEKCPHCRHWSRVCDVKKSVARG